MAQGVNAKLTYEGDSASDEQVEPAFGPTTSPQYWVEKTIIKGRPDRSEGEYSLGRALWSPQRGKSGSDIYRFMRDIRLGDVIIHLTDNEAVTGISRCAVRAQEFNGLPHTQWGEGPSYVVRLRDFTRLDPPLSREVFFGSSFKGRLIQLVNSGVNNLFYNRGLALNQGAYLTPAPRELVDVLNDAYHGLTGRNMTDLLPSGAPVVDGNATPERARPSTAPLDDVVTYVSSRGFIFEPWQIAAYITALRTKPFVILAGVSGTGKSKLPALIADATGGVSQLIPVRPDWTDSSDVLGYTDLAGRFRPGPLLQLASTAAGRPDRQFVCIIDEMNLARVEHYFAEVLSRIEDRAASPHGGFQSKPLLSQTPSGPDAKWGSVFLPPNLAIVGTVNMDESAHGFSRKVLDRAFTVEFSDVNLSLWEGRVAVREPATWAPSAWYPRSIQLSGVGTLASEEREFIQGTVGKLAEINGILGQAQLQVGYRTRDEVCLFLLHARDCASSFVTAEGEAVDPLDLAFHMKILPRIAGGSFAVRHTLLQLLGWTNSASRLETDEDAELILDPWRSAGRPDALPGARFPRTTARLCLMWDRLINDGFTSFWL
jgi:AAA domain (dynein-related subfamily)